MAEVLLVMRKRGNVKVLSETLTRDGYIVSGAMGREDVDAALARAAKPDVALVDPSGYGDEVWSICEALQRSQVPFLVVSGPRRRSAGSKELGVGAASVLEKPLVKSSLLKMLAGLTRR